MIMAGSTSSFGSRALRMPQSSHWSSNILKVPTLGFSLLFCHFEQRDQNSTIALGVKTVLSSDFSLEEVLKSFAVLSKLLDTLMELIKRHLFLEERPAELWLVVDIGYFGNRVSLAGCDM